MSVTGPALVWSPFPDGDAAAEAASTLLDEGLIACANIFPAVRSLYLWQGERGDAAEAGVLFKTNAAQLSRLVARLAELHPYAEPAILGWKCEDASAGTAIWLAALGAGPSPA